jgi:FKBP-type peptidyl-prolyl cis-trans isomerase FkpA
VVVSIVLASIAVGTALWGSGCKEQRINMTAEHATRWSDVRTGSGLEAREGMMVEVVYWLAMPDGSRLVDLYAQKRTHPFRIGDGTVISGLDRAVRGMRPGGIRDVLLPPIAHYGRAGYAGVIPEDTTLTMQVELLQISN